MFLKVVFASGMWYSGRLEHANHEKLNGERCFWKLSLHPASDKATASHMPIMRNLTVRCFWKSCLYPAWYSDSLTRQSWETQRWDVFESRLCIRLLMRLRPATEPMFSVQNDILVFQNVTLITQRCEILFNCVETVSDQSLTWHTKKVASKHGCLGQKKSSSDPSKVSVLQWSLWDLFRQK